MAESEAALPPRLRAARLALDVRRSRGAMLRSVDYADGLREEDGGENSASEAFRELQKEMYRRGRQLARLGGHWWGSACDNSTILGQHKSMTDLVAVRGLSTLRDPARWIAVVGSSPDTATFASRELLRKQRDEKQTASSPPPESASYQTGFSSLLSVFGGWLESCDLPIDDGNGGGSDRVVHQSRRDVERDRISMNGHVLDGAVTGYDGILDALADEFLLQERAILGEEDAESSSDADTLPERRGAAARLLQITNRTSSGGDSFEALLRLVDGLDGVLLVPDSARAPPLAFHIDCGPFHATPRDAEKRPWEWDFGIRVRVEAETVFRVVVSEASDRDADGDVDPSAPPVGCLRARYVRAVAIPLPWEEITDEMERSREDHLRSQCMRVLSAGASEEEARDGVAWVSCEGESHGGVLVWFERP